MASATAARSWSSGKVAGVVILAVIGIVAVIVSVLYLTEPAKSLPSILGAITQPASRANAHRSLRGELSLAFGVICLLGAGIISWVSRPAAK